MKEFEPRILIFACDNWKNIAHKIISIQGISYPQNGRTISLPCAKRVAPTFILNALKVGVDGILILACQETEYCSVKEESHLDEMVNKTHSIMDLLGINPNRLNIVHFSLAEPNSWIQPLSAFIEELKELEPNKLGSLS